MTTSRHLQLHRAARRRKPIRLALAMEQKVAIPNTFGSYTASMHMSGVTVHHTDEMIEAAAARSVIAFSAMRARLVAVLQEARKNNGFTP